jgi:hypothetical protein
MSASHKFAVGKIPLGGGAPLFLIAGPCVTVNVNSAPTNAKGIRTLNAAVTLASPFNGKLGVMVAV